MNFDLADLRAMVAVADLGSFRAAAEALHLSQSAVSRRVDKLEEALGVELFQRSTRRVELTTIGRTFLHRARGVIHDLEAALVGIADFADRISGELSVACVPSAVSYFLPQVIERFHRQHPRIRVRLIDESSSALLLAVANGEADLGLTYIGTQEPDIEFVPLLEDRFVVACPPGHPLAQRSRVSWADLAPYERVSLAHGSGNRMLIDQALAQVEAQPGWFCEVRHVPALVSLVEAGLGIGVVPAMALPPRGPVVAVPLEAPAVSRTIGIIRRRGRPLRPPAELFQRLLVALAGPGGSAADPAVGSPAGAPGA